MKCMSNVANNSGKREIKYFRDYIKQSGNE